MKVGREVMKLKQLDNIVYGCSQLMFLLEIDRSVIGEQALSHFCKVIVSFCHTVDPIRRPPLSICKWDWIISIFLGLLEIERLKYRKFASRSRCCYSGNEWSPVVALL